MKNIELEIEEPFRISEKGILSKFGEDHHTLYIYLPQNIIKAVATGTMEYWAGNSEGLITFVFFAGHYSKVNTQLVSGGDGTTTYMKLSATYTAPLATTIMSLLLKGTKNSHVDETTFSAKDVNQVLAAGQTYTINWILHADI